jgi:transcriptional regulator with XRE-family HTH domain
MDQNSTLGSRVRALRLERGLSQADLAGDSISASYISLIESGHRSPEKPILERLAKRLNTSLGYLETGTHPEEANERQLWLRFAEIALANGSAAEAQDRFQQLAALKDPVTWSAATWGLARASEALGELFEALSHIEALIDAVRRGEAGGPGLVTLMTQRCRLYSEAGDFGRSIDLGEAAIAEVRELGLEGSSEEIQLASTLVASYWGRGDLVHAQRLAEEVIARAERTGSSKSRGAAYWNASMICEARGQLPRALELAEKALILMSEEGSDRSLARLRMTLGWLLLRTDAPDLDRARDLLERAYATLQERSGGVDLAGCETELARCDLLAGRPELAIETARLAMSRLESQPTVEWCRSVLVLGLALAATGQIDDGVRECHRAAETMQVMGARMEAAQAWRDTAELLLGLGRTHDAVAALRRVADCSGVRALPPTISSVNMVASISR